MTIKMTRGAERLLAWRKREKLKQRHVAAKLDISGQEISAYEHGDKIPGLERAVMIEKLTDGYVKPEHWLKPASAAA